MKDLQICGGTNPQLVISSAERSNCGMGTEKGGCEIDSQWLGDLWAGLLVEGQQGGVGGDTDGRVVAAQWRESLSKL